VKFISKIIDKYCQKHCRYIEYPFVNPVEVLMRADNRVIFFRKAENDKRDIDKRRRDRAGTGGSG
jgi:hypothetical protein